ncbi:hypothetical protein MPDQ_003474 [Monascus purpureus]|uniref:Uncharacterized protein n=1 Tax=Monascus purpureus TaxID=5098 RepID=A0A507QYY9_MONPU|nr:hypothetical protein MPDQ_003474 [Monascus purpureus]BDD57126.1 hypothetical protein MAP00_002519 [Monascus purpureus]
MVFWATRVLRPQISVCISQIQYSLKNPVPQMPVESLEQWQDKDIIRRRRPNLHIVLVYIDQALELDSPDSITVKDMKDGLRWDEIDKALRILRKSNEENLRHILTDAMKCLDADACLEVLEPETSALSKEKMLEMGRRAL